MDMVGLHGNKHYVIVRCYMTWPLIKKYVFLVASCALVSRIMVARLTILPTNEVCIVIYIYEELVGVHHAILRFIIDLLLN